MHRCDMNCISLQDIFFNREKQTLFIQQKSINNFIEDKRTASCQQRAERWERLFFVSSILPITFMLRNWTFLFLLWLLSVFQTSSFSSFFDDQWCYTVVMLPSWYYKKTQLLPLEMWARPGFSNGDHKVPHWTTSPGNESLLTQYFFAADSEWQFVYFESNSIKRQHLRQARTLCNQYSVISKRGH